MKAFYWLNKNKYKKNYSIKVFFFWNSNMKKKIRELFLWVRRAFCLDFFLKKIISTGNDHT